MYCSKCGSNLADDATFCSQCGAQTGVAPALAPSGAHPPVLAEIPNAVGYGVAPQVYVQPVARVAYAGFWLRVLAYLIDMIVLGLFSIPIAIGGAAVLGVGGVIQAILHNEDPFQNGPPATFILFLMFLWGLGLFGTWLYFALLESSEWQGTAGKKVLGLIVTDMQGRRVTFLRATGRYFAKFVTHFTCGIGYAMAGLTEKRQALHDMIASCLVLRRN